MNGNTIKAIRLFNSHSQKSFAKELGFSSSGIAAVESGRYDASERLRVNIQLVKILLIFYVSTKK